ncbi:MAG: sugar phosphate isomerase/epimerase [Phycisphaeraceae bacterium]|nr:sugar phosphate isomerase/epimerase [Phycisphaeraceae bacterium]
MTWTLSAFADEAGIPVEEQIAALNKVGMRRIDLRSVDGHNISQLPVDVAKTVRRKLDAAGIVVNMFGSPLGKIDIADDVEIDLAKLRHMGELSRILGCNQIRIFSYYNKQNKAAETWRKESLDRLGKLRDLASKLNLVLYHENESDIYGSRLEANLVLAEKLRDGRNFKLIFDFDNYNRDGDDTWKNWQALKDRTDAFHLKDSDKQAQHVPAGQGSGKVKEILADAMACNWQGPLVLEPHLKYSKAVLATHVSGHQNKAYSELTEAECFNVAAVAAIALLKNLGVQWQ